MKNQNHGKKGSSLKTEDLLHKIDDEEKRRKMLQEWKDQHLHSLETLKSDLKKSQEDLKGEKEKNKAIKDELEEVKEKLVSVTMELMQFKEDAEVKINEDAPHVSPPTPTPGLLDKIPKKERASSFKMQKGGGSLGKSDVTQANQTEKGGGVRSWNKKVIYDLQDANRQLSDERKLRKSLEAWKLENEEKIEELKKKVRNEVEARVKLEEAYKRLEKEVSQAKEQK